MTDVERLRVALGLDKTKFARIVGVTTRTIDRWENGDACSNQVVVALRKANDGPGGMRIRSLIVCLVHEKRGRLLDLLLELFDEYGG